MGNLGMYQTITKLSKKVGGPDKLLLIVGLAGYGVGKIVEYPIKKGIEVLKNRANHQETGTYKFTVSITDEKEFTVSKGNCFSVLEKDGEAVLISIDGDTNSPYYIDESWLKEISNYNGQVG